MTEKLDYEVELVAVVGAAAKGASEADAPSHVFGYTVGNDVSARDWQFHMPTFTMGKSFDTHGSIGPWIVTADEIADPHALDLRGYVNGELRQSNNTGAMINDLWAQIAYLSTAFTLEPGDLIATGTPEGVGVGMESPAFLQPGDVVRCEVEGIGAIGRHTIGSNFFHYIQDPWGSWLEYFSDMDHIDDYGLWAPTNYGMEDSLASWGPEVPHDFVHNDQVDPQPFAVAA